MLSQMGKVNILLLEDDDFNIQLIKTLLNKISPKINVISANKGEKALNLLELGEDNIDLILLDLHLPGMGGKEVLEYVRRNPKYSTLPVVIISVDGFDELELRKKGADDFILKPFNIDDFAKKLSVHLVMERRGTNGQKD